MDLSQISYAALLFGAIWWGGPDWRLSALCVGNFLGTMILSASPLSVGVLDMTTIALLIYIGTWRGYALAFIFAVLVPIYVIAAYLAWSIDATYAIIDPLGYAIPGVLASGRGGHRNRRCSDRRRRGGGSGASASGGIATQGVGAYSKGH